MTVPHDQPCPVEVFALAYAAGELPGDECVEMETHLARCPWCLDATALLANLLAPETEEETALVEAVGERTAAAARELIRKHLESRDAKTARRLSRGDSATPSRDVSSRT